MTEDEHGTCRHLLSATVGSVGSVGSVDLSATVGLSALCRPSVEYSCRSVEPELKLQPSQESLRTGLALLFRPHWY